MNHNLPVHVPVDEVREVNNPRRSFDEAGIQELADSIKLYGVLQPIGVRIPKKRRKGWELVYGARRLRAAKAAGMKEILAIEVSGDSVGEMRLVENIQRADLSPLDEAAAIVALRDDGLDVREIARRLGKRVSYVARRANLETLADPVKKQLLAGELDPSWSVGHLELLSLLPADQQSCDGAACTLEYLHEEVADATRTLGQARWDLDDETLDPKAGACSRCVKHSGHAPGLFDDGDQATDASSATCLDTPCWQRKLELWGKRRISELRAEHGQQLILVEGGFEFGSDRIRPRRLKGGERVFESWECKRAKKGAKSARPAFVVGGKGAGQVLWVTLNHESPSARRSTKAIPGKKSDDKKPAPGSKADLAAKRRRLADRRAVWTIRDVAERVMKHPQPPGEHELLVLAARFGFGGFDLPLRTLSWRRTEEHLDGARQDELALKVWLRVQDNIRKWLAASEGPRSRTEGLNVARTLARVCLGDDEASLAERAKDAIPAPKALSAATPVRRKAKRTPRKKAKKAR